MGKSSIGRWSKELENVQHPRRPPRKRSSAKKYSELGRNHREDRSVCDHSQAQMDPTGYHRIMSLSTVYRCLKTLKMSYKVAASPQHQAVDPTTPFLASTTPVYDDGISIETCFVSCDTKRWAQEIVRYQTAKASSNYFTSFGHRPLRCCGMSFGRKLQHRIFQGLCGTVTSSRKLIMDNVAFHRSKW
jgi:hypothetical protein